MGCAVCSSCGFGSTLRGPSSLNVRFYSASWISRAYGQICQSRHILSRSSILGDGRSSTNFWYSILQLYLLFIRKARQSLFFVYQILTWRVLILSSLCIIYLRWNILFHSFLPWLLTFNAVDSVVRLLSLSTIWHRTGLYRLHFIIRSPTAMAQILRRIDPSWHSFAIPCYPHFEPEWINAEVSAPALQYFSRYVLHYSIRIAIKSETSRNFTLFPD